MITAKPVAPLSQLDRLTSLAPRKSPARPRHLSRLQSEVESSIGWCPGMSSMRPHSQRAPSRASLQHSARARLAALKRALHTYHIRVEVESEHTNQSTTAPAAAVVELNTVVRHLDPRDLDRLNSHAILGEGIREQGQRDRRGLCRPVIVVNTCVHLPPSPAPPRLLARHNSPILRLLSPASVL